MDNEIFEDYEDAGLEADGEEARDKGPLQGDAELDFDAGYERPKHDRCEQVTRQTDYEAMPGRVRTGKDGELDLSRVSLDGEGRAAGGGDGADWESNMSTRQGSTALDSPGAFVSSSIGSTAYTGGHEDVDEDLHREMLGAGLRLGMASVDTYKAGFAIANAAYMKNKLRWQSKGPEERKWIYAQRKQQRANRGWEKVRADSIHREYLKHYNGFIKDRTEADPYWSFMDPDEISKMDGVDSRSARQIAETWRMATDEKALNAFVVKYTALVNDVKADSIRAKFKRKPHEKDLAEFVFVHDMLACDCVSSCGFDKDELLSAHGGDLVEMETPASFEERREFIIEGSHELYKGGSLYPPFCWDPINPILDRVVALLEAEDIDLLADQEPEIDWSRV